MFLPGLVLSHYTIDIYEILIIQDPYGDLLTLKIEEYEPRESRSPSIFQMMKSFTKDVVAHVKGGAKNVSAEDYAIRLDICNGCEHLKKQSMRCGLCGCLLEHKAKWKISECPDTPQRWPKQEKPPRDDVKLGTDPTIANRND